jgi:hypothetical protein
MLRPILRHFEFEYADGYLFWDKAGRVARDLAQAFPGLRLRNQLIDQRDFFVPNSTLELFFGIRIASLRVFEGDGQEFRSQAGLLLEILREELELETLTTFRFQFALGWPCQTHEEAHMLTMKLLPAEVGQNLKSGQFQAAQLETRQGDLVTTRRYTILELAPPPGPARPDLPGPRMPHFVASILSQSLEPFPIRDLKTIAHLEEMENLVTENLLKEITAKLDAKPA